MTKIKICGLSRFEDVEAINRAKPDYCGFVVNYPKSPRNISVEHLIELTKKVDSTIIPVGVFVDEPIKSIAELLNLGIIGVAQLHGNEDESYVKALQSLAPGKSVWKAFTVRTTNDIQQAQQSAADLVILDNGKGTGKPFCWKLAAQLQRPFMLAGGLTPENLEQAEMALHPYGFDLSGGVETFGIKDAEKISRAVGAVKKFNLTYSNQPYQIH